MTTQTEINVNKTHNKESAPKKKSLQWMRDKDREPVKGIFRFFEVPGGQMSFCYRAYKQDKTERFDLVDGQIYTLPLGVARHLNKNGWYPIHSFMHDETGKPHMKVGQKKRRFGFQSLEFVDIDEFEDNSNELVTVEKV